MRLLTALLAAALLAHAQQNGPAVYKVEFDIRANNDAPAQHFSMLVDESRKGVFQSATRVPLATGSPRFAEVGVTIECTVQESGGKATLEGTIEISAITGYVSLSAISQPIIAQRKVAFHTPVELGAAAVIMDDRKAQVVEATVTKQN